MNNAKIFVTILLLISPIDILGEKVSKYSKQNQRIKTKEN